LNCYLLVQEAEVTIHAFYRASSDKENDESLILTEVCEQSCILQIPLSYIFF
jgi:hypothetical protein